MGNIDTLFAPAKFLTPFAAVKSAPRLRSGCASAQGQRADSDRGRNVRGSAEPNKARPSTLLQPPLIYMFGWAPQSMQMRMRGKPLFPLRKAKFCNVAQSSIKFNYTNDSILSGTFVVCRSDC